MCPPKPKGPAGIRSNAPRISSNQLLSGHNHNMNVKLPNSKNGISSVENSKNLSSPHLPPLTGSNQQTSEVRPTDVSPEIAYQNGISLLKSDPSKALENFRLAAEKQHVGAMYQYAKLLATDSQNQTTALRIMKTAAQMGQKDAIFEYGQMLEKGIGCPVNREEAYVVYQKGIKNGDGNSMYRCAKLLKEARRNPSEMYSLFKEAADLHIPGAFFERAICLRDGVGVEKNQVEATRIFKQLCESNDPQGMLEYAICLKNGTGIQKDMQTFSLVMGKAVATNSPDARLTYARMLESGDGFTQNVEAAEKIYRELADNGNPFAQNCLASLLQSQGKVGDALKYYQLSAAQHHPTALFSLAMLQLRLANTSSKNDIIVVKNEGIKNEIVQKTDHSNPKNELFKKETLRKEGMENLRKAADAGNERAQFNYALYLEKDRNSDKKEIAKYYKLASDAGLPNAMCNYASYVMKTDEAEAVRLFKQAADKGHTISMYRYARFMLKRDIEVSIQYFDMAAANGHPKSQYELANIKLEMNDKDNGFRLLKLASEGGYHKAKEKYIPLISAVPNAEKDEDGKYNVEQIFEYCKHIPDSNSVTLFDKYITEETQLSKLRRAQLLLTTDTKSGLATISELAKGGFVEAKYIYATILEKGKLTKPNMLEAKKYYQEASKAQHALAMSAYGRLVKVEDQVSAVRLFKEAADQNLPIAQYQYARMLEISGAEEEALKYYKMASDAGVAKAQFRYGRMHEICSKIKRSYETAATYYKMASAQRYPKAMNNYAHMLEVGLGIDADPKLAANYYKKAMDLGNIYASHNYARILEHGIGVKKDPESAAQIYKKLSEDEDNGLAQYNYARMCHNGIGVTEDYEEAKKYYLMAIDNNIAEAKQNYGVLLFTKFQKWSDAARYFEMAVSGNGGQPSAKYNYAQLLMMQGMGVPEDPNLAERLFQEAAATFLPAMVSYAQILEGKDGDDAIKLAAEYYKKAADMEDENHKFIKPQRQAQYLIALMYKNGRGVEKDMDMYEKYRVSGNVMSLSIIKSFLISYFLLISISKYVVSIGINNFFQSILPFCKN
ncbi:hypothetical protein TRFO_02260 [Tritrichomonas foetus]|uniref:Sel1 repeat family protein n=1 Tax=Tritrichomonas foetus TaxID=1144522 RepID=A0A1J4JDB7_9EUKA|nr:hypothetical protein TRFO_02260 [Tritrichomonas foetus]|eukprot:OHS95268.1 hypothetical protein TRFO_02260 [Tritrichomonas foetus]